MLHDVDQAVSHRRCMTSSPGDVQHFPNATCSPAVQEFTRVAGARNGIAKILLKLLRLEVRMSASRIHALMTSSLSECSLAGAENDRNDFPRTVTPLHLMLELLGNGRSM